MARVLKERAFYLGQSGKRRFVMFRLQYVIFNDIFLIMGFDFGT